MADRILIDTCIWATVFARPNSPENRTVGELIEDDRVVVIGPVLAEVLVGFRRREQANWAASRLKNLGWIVIEWDDWREAAALGRHLATSGQRLPLTDLVIAAIALRHDLPVYTVDPHFDRFSNLQRFP
jgi:predicted nucleic acid-binding protein